MESPSLMRSPKSGDSLVTVYIFGITQSTVEMLGGSGPPSVQLWEKYCREVLKPDGLEDLEMKGRFKAITKVANIDDVNIPGVAKPFNGKPVLIKKTGVLTKSADVLEMSVNVYLWPFHVKSGFSMTFPTFPTMILDSAFVIEGRDDSELQEQILGCVRVSFPRPELAVPL